MVTKIVLLWRELPQNVFKNYYDICLGYGILIYNYNDGIVYCTKCYLCKGATFHFDIFCDII